jgi:Dual specificity phosphatase, catalytic domain/Leucine rich repeat
MNADSSGEDDEGNIPSSVKTKVYHNSFITRDNNFITRDNSFITKDNNDNDESDPEIFLSSTKVYQSQSYLKKNHDFCSVCKTSLINKIHYVCKTCGESNNTIFCVCGDCMYDDKNHDVEHTLELCSEHKIIEQEEQKMIQAIPSPFVLTPKILSPRGSLQEVITNSLSGVSSKRNSESSNESLNQSKLLLLKRSTGESLSEDIHDISIESTPQLVGDASELVFDFLQINSDNSIFSDPSCIGAKLKHRKSLKKNEGSFNELMESYDESSGNKLFLDGLLTENLELFYAKIRDDKFSQLEILNIAENYITHFSPTLLSLVNIRELNLEKNCLRKLPEEIELLVNLTNLDVGYNLLVDLPYSMSKLKKLHTIILDFNQFRQIPPVITEMNELKILYIEGNHEILSFPPNDKLADRMLEIHIDNNPELMEKAKNIPNLNVCGNCYYPSKILDNLYLGSYRSTLNEYVYKHLDISSVYTIGRDMTPLITHGMNHKIYIIDDSPGSTINFDILDSIHEDIQNGRICLIHCQMGMSRSSTVVISYLMKYYNMKLDEAYQYVLDKRSNICPNEGFLSQLNELNKKLYPDAKHYFR